MRVLQSFGKFGRHKPLITSTPTKIMGPRTRSQMSIWNLPEEVILHILKRMSVKDVLNVMSVHSYFHDLINNNPAVWASVSFRGTWPSVPNIRHFTQAAELGNFEAAIKLAIAYLYHEGLPWSDPKLDTNNGDHAARMFCLAESLNKSGSPFAWLFIRPPWSQCGSCCKQCVFNKMTTFTSTDPWTHARVHICVAKIFALLDIDDKAMYEAAHLQAAADRGSSQGAYALWQRKYSHTITDRGEELASVRELRDIATGGHLEVRLQLCRYYAQGRYGGVGRDQAAAYVRGEMQAARVSASHNVFSSSHALTPSMRYILVDWLVEVVGMKDFSSQVLHVAISVIDRYLSVNQTPRSQLQLLGVSALVLCSRYLGKDIITIREAAWLTDNTYKYEDVVRMLGEITATLHGNFREATILDYMEVVSEIAGLGATTQCLARYICELTLLQAKMGQYIQSEIAASSVVIAKALLSSENCWTQDMQWFTGFSLDRLQPCIVDVYKRCYLDGAIISHRDVTLQAVKDRYATDRYFNISKTTAVELSVLCATLGVSEVIHPAPRPHHSLHKHRELIKSPSRSTAIHPSAVTWPSTRDMSTTPTIEPSLNDSILSGYDGDLEDEPDCDMDCTDAPPAAMAPSFTHDDDTYFATLSNITSAASFIHLDFSTQFAASVRHQQSTSHTTSSHRQLTTSLPHSPDEPSSSGVSSFMSARALHGTGSHDSSSDPESEEMAESVSPVRYWTAFTQQRPLKRKSQVQAGGATKTFVFS